MAYDPNSIVDFLKSNNLPSDLNFRSQLYQGFGLGSAQDYHTGAITGESNSKLLAFIKNNPDQFGKIASTLIKGSPSSTGIPQEASLQPQPQGSAFSNPLKLPTSGKEINQFQTDANAGVSFGAAPVDPITSLIPQGLDPQIQESLKTLITNIDQSIKDLSDPNKNQETFVNEYNRLRTEQGLPDLESQQLNLGKIINGTVQDIRNEVASSGGIATESQIQAMADARNKVLLQQYQVLQDSIANKRDYVEKVVSLSGQDRQATTKKIDDLYNLEDKLISTETKIEDLGIKRTQAWFTTQQKSQAQALTQLKTAFSSGVKLTEEQIQDFATKTGIDPQIIKNADKNDATKFAFANALNNARTMYYNAGFTSLNPGDISNLATMFMNGYPIQNLFKGMAANGYISQILNNAMGQINSSGSSIDDVIINSQNYKGNQSVLDQEKKRQGAIITYEEAVNAQIPIVKSAFNAYIKATGNKSESQAFNQLYQYYTGKLIGSEADVIKPFYLAIDRMATEWAKVTSGSLGSAEVSITAAQHMRDILSPTSGPKTLNNLFSIITQDMAAQRKGIANSINFIDGNLVPFHPSTGFPTNGVSTSVNNWLTQNGY